LNEGFYLICKDYSNLLARVSIPLKPMMHIAYSPLFPQNVYISLYFHKMYTFPPISAKFINSPSFSSIYVCFLNLCFFAFPYFDLDAFLHLALHVLDALAYCERKMEMID